MLSSPLSHLPTHNSLFPARRSLSIEAPSLDSTLSLKQTLDSLFFSLVLRLTQNSLSTPSRLSLFLSLRRKISLSLSLSLCRLSRSLPFSPLPLDNKTPHVYSHDIRFPKNQESSFTLSGSHDTHIHPEHTLRVYARVAPPLSLGQGHRFCVQTVVAWYSGSWVLGLWSLV